MNKKNQRNVRGICDDLAWAAVLQRFSKAKSMRFLKDTNANSAGDKENK